MSERIEQIISSPYKLDEVEQETQNVKMFRFSPTNDQEVAFEPGMFFMIEYRDNDGSKIKRAYSVASAPGSKILEFYIGMVGGKLTSKLDSAKKGDLYYISGPYGKFKFSQSENKKSLFIAAGTGISPFMSMLRGIEGNGLDEDVVMLYSVKTTNGIIKRDELNSIKSRTKLKTIITLTKPEQNDVWQGYTGRITKELIEKEVEDIGERTCYLCGSNEFTKAMTDYLLVLGVKKENIKKDVW